ncbi:hypothetical protein BsWGS_01296 [Bradybaena similaris]
MEVHHLSKQFTPDWQGLCPKVYESEKCARSYIEGCDQCKKETVLTIVEKLNSQLEETCRDPPLSECEAVSAMQCVKDLEKIQESSQGLSNNTICTKITTASQCVYKKTKKCDAVTTLSITHSLEVIISDFGLNCTPPDALKCFHEFKTVVNEILNTDLNAVLISRQHNNATMWDKLESLCEIEEEKWSCISTHLESKDGEIGAEIVVNVLETLHISVTKVCKSQQEPLECYACDGDGENSCAKGHTNQTCKDNEICGTTTWLDKAVSRVTHRGCIPRTDCEPGCDEHGCTFCCSDNHCNNADYGPVEGTCSLVAVAGCAFKLSQSVIETKDFKCSSAEAYQKCLAKEKIQCDIGGSSFVIESMLSLNLNAAIQICLIQEASQTCETLLIATTISYISSNIQLDDDSLCGIVAESRSQVSLAQSQCTKEQVSEIQKAEIALETFIGHLNCSNFTIDIDCKPAEATLCTAGIDIVKSPTLNCSTFTQIVDCIKPKVHECTSDAEIFLVNTEVDLLKSVLPADSSCKNLTLVDSVNITINEFTVCLYEFSKQVRYASAADFFKAIIDYKSCLLNISDEDIISLEISQKLQLEIVVTFITTIINAQTSGELNLNITVSQSCSPLLTSELFKYSLAIFGLPFIPKQQRDSICSQIDASEVTTVKTITSNCNVDEATKTFEILDMVRERFLIDFCPEIRPVRRCLINYVQECYTSFRETIDFASKAKSCKEASIFTKCAIDYSSTCGQQDLQNIKYMAVNNAEFTSQVCADDYQLITDARCKLLCKANGGSECTEISSNCSTIPTTCDRNKSLECLTNLVNHIDENSMQVAKDCLENFFYCAVSVNVLISEDFEQYATLEAIIGNFTLSWDKLDSSDFKIILIFATYIRGILDQNKYVTLSTWDQCYKLSKIADAIENSLNRNPKLIFPSTVQTQRNIRKAITEFCNIPAQELILPPGGKENPACPDVVVTAMVNVLFSRGISEIITPKAFGDQSICSLYIRLKNIVEATVQEDVNLNNCSDGFNVKIRFAMKIAASFLGQKCEVDYDIPRCDIDRVKLCVKTLHQNFLLLGKTQTIPGLCTIYQKTEACVEKYSYKCGTCARRSIDSVYGSLKVSAQQMCDIKFPVFPGCEGEPKPKKCDLDAAIKCATQKFLNILNPFGKKDDKCRQLQDNLDCISEATQDCTQSLPVFLHNGVKKAKVILTKLGCNDNKPSNNSVCRDGCMVNKASWCVEQFKLNANFELWQNDKLTTCRHINVLKMCVAGSIRSCPHSVSTSINQFVDAVLLQFSGREDVCIDLIQITEDFDVLVRQITNLKLEKPDSDSDDDDDDDQDDDDDDDDNDDGDEKHDTSMQSLTALCLRIKKPWEILEKKLLQNLPVEKMPVVVPLYKEISESVTQKCSNTRPRECYKCKDTKSSADCETQIQTCSHKQSTCRFTRTYDGNGFVYNAGCDEKNTCYPNSDGLTSTYTCASSLCNTKGNSSNSCELEPATCKMESAFTCALDLATRLMVSEDINCSYAGIKLECILSSAVQCKNKNLLQAASKILLELASTTCVFNARPNDCESLAVISIQTILRSAYANEGNAVCVAAKEANDDVTRLIAGGTCSAFGKVSLEQVLQFVDSIISTYCNDNKCTNRTVETQQHCSGQIFNHVKSIYEAAMELEKPETYCPSAAYDLWDARLSLSDCGLGKFVDEHLNAVNLHLTSKCQQLPILPKRPEVCPGECQAAAVISYTLEIHSIIAANPAYAGMLVRDVEFVFNEFTSGCTSIQQHDLAIYIDSVLGQYIKQIQLNITSFELELTFKRDVFYVVVMWRKMFQFGYETSFCRNSLKILCEAIANGKTYKWNPPGLLSGFFHGIFDEFYGSLNQLAMCEDSGQDNDTTVNQFEELGHLLGQFILPPKIETFTLDSRKLICRNIDLRITKAESLYTGCSAQLSAYQIKMYNFAISNIKEVHRQFCIPLHYEEPKCDFELVSKCWADYTAVSDYANAETETLCRLAQFALDCTQRFTENCSAGLENETAIAIREIGKIIVKDSLANDCPYLTPYLYCNGTVTASEPACSLDKAESCKKNINIDINKMDDAKYC